MAIFSLIAKLGLDGSTFETGLKRATSLADKFRYSVSAQLGSALSVASVAAFTSKVIETADAIGDPNAIAEAIDQVLIDAVSRGTLRGGATLA